MRYEIWKREKAKDGFELGSIASKSARFTIYVTDAESALASCLVLIDPITRQWAESV